VVNYLARLGWSHGDDEIFSRAQLIEWFNLDHLGKSAAQFDEAKLRWVNAQHIKAMPMMNLRAWWHNNLKSAASLPMSDWWLFALCSKTAVTPPWCWPIGRPSFMEISKSTPRIWWGYSSAGRALAWHARGQRFDPAYLHQICQ
jgi:hypothetical protein